MTATRRRCFVHIGTHKTGTTSIQAVLNSTRPELAQRGILYPKAGAPPLFEGHHNIAWELSGSPRFEPSYGTVRDLLEEIDGSDHDVVISSEDFECAVLQGGKFEAFIGELRRRAPALSIVVYLRNQVDYATSLYLELLRHGFDWTFNDFVTGAIEQRTFRWRDWAFPFCYRELAKSLPAGADIIARPYSGIGSTVADFFSMLGPPATGLHVNIDLRRNPRLSVADGFLAFYRNRMGRELAEGKGPAISAIGLAFGASQVGMMESTKDRLIAAFEHSNRDAELLYGISGLQNPLPESPGAKETDRLYVEDIFSLATIRLAGQLAPMLQ